MMVRLLERVLDRFVHRKIQKSFSWSPATKASQAALYARYAEAGKSGSGAISLRDAGFRNTSQVDEDGLLLYIFAAIGSGERVFVELGSSNGLECNCANLALNFGWHGLFVDADPEKVRQGRAFYARHPDTWIHPPRFVEAKLSRENVNDVIREGGITGPVDLLSIDIDGNDFWVWDAIDCIEPRVVIIETHVEFGLENKVVPYDPEYVYPGRHPVYHGASPVAMKRLADRLGYRLVGANRYGFNTLYVRRGIGEEVLPEIPVEDVLRHGRNRERVALLDQVRHLPFEEV